MFPKSSFVPQYVNFAKKIAGKEWSQNLTNVKNTCQTTLANLKSKSEVLNEYQAVVNSKATQLLQNVGARPLFDGAITSLQNKLRSEELMLKWSENVDNGKNIYQVTLNSFKAGTKALEDQGMYWSKKTTELIQNANAKKVVDEAITDFQNKLNILRNNTKSIDISQAFKWTEFAPLAGISLLTKYLTTPTVTDSVIGAVSQMNAFTSLGVGEWSFNELLGTSFEYLPLLSGIPGWEVVVIGIIGTVPLVIIAQRHAAKMDYYLPQMQTFLAKMTNARQSGNYKLPFKIYEYCKKTETFIPVSFTFQTRASFEKITFKFRLATEKSFTINFV